jgi:hypothetical protein
VVIPTSTAAKNKRKATPKNKRKATPTSREGTRSGSRAVGAGPGMHSGSKKSKVWMRSKKPRKRLSRAQKLKRRANADIGLNEMDSDVTVQTIQDHNLRSRALSLPVSTDEHQPRNVTRVTPSYRPFGAAMSMTAVDCLVWAFVLLMSGLITNIDTSGLLVYTLQDVNADKTGRGFNVDELSRYLRAKCKGHVLFEPCNQVFADGEPDLLVLAELVRSRVLCGTYILRVMVKYPDQKQQSPHFVGLLMNAHRPIIRDPLQPGDHPFQLCHLYARLHIVSLCKMHEVKVWRDSPLLQCAL